MSVSRFTGANWVATGFKMAVFKFKRIINLLKITFINLKTFHFWIIEVIKVNIVPLM